MVPLIKTWPLKNDPWLKFSLHHATFDEASSVIEFSTVRLLSTGNTISTELKHLIHAFRNKKESEPACKINLRKKCIGNIQSISSRLWSISSYGSILTWIEFSAAGGALSRKKTNDFVCSFWTEKLCEFIMGPMTPVPPSRGGCTALGQVQGSHYRASHPWPSKSSFVILHLYRLFDLEQKFWKKN